MNLYGASGHSKVVRGIVEAAGVSVGESLWVGAGATVIPSIRIGAWNLISAGCVVVEDIPDSVLAYGNSCRVARVIQYNILSSNNLWERDNTGIEFAARFSYSERRKAA
ncbi:MAG: hypothetical protein K5778_09015 [Bacteroidaceae bacterium]|nr:hypothetical protein [Bacteroidaceae bacterium]